MLTEKAMDGAWASPGRMQASKMIVMKLRKSSSGDGYTKSREKMHTVVRSRCRFRKN